MAKHKNISWCDGWRGIDRHPTERKLVSVKDQDIKISLCPDCYKDYSKDQKDQRDGWDCINMV